MHSPPHPLPRNVQRNDYVRGFDRLECFFLFFLFFFVFAFLHAAYIELFVLELYVYAGGPAGRLLFGDFLCCLCPFIYAHISVIPLIPSRLPSFRRIKQQRQQQKQRQKG
jgi:hypothetical protein